MGFCKHYIRPTCGTCRNPGDGPCSHLRDGKAIWGVSLWGWPWGVPGAQHSPVSRGWVAGGTRTLARLTGTHRCAHHQPLRLLLLPVLLPHNPGVPEASPLPTAPKIPSSPCVLEISRPLRDRELPGSVWLSIPGAEPGDQQAGQLWLGPWPAL